jgi:hypothetical protein
MRLSILLAASTLGLAGCADYYGPYGYSGVSFGVGYAGGYGGYGDYGYGYAPYYGSYYGGYDPFGWYGDYYYPGTGVYVYDSYHRAHHWNGDQSRYWTTRRSNWEGRTGGTWNRDNWSGFHRSGGGTTSTTTGGHWHHRG